VHLARLDAQGDLSQSLMVAEASDQKVNFHDGCLLVTLCHWFTPSCR
jgi:hypothetical protein